MGSTAVRVVLSTLLVATAVAGVVPTGGTAATPPAVTVTVDGTAVADGNATFVESDPTVGVTADADRSIRVVSVRVDGETVRRATPNATSFDDEFDIDLSSGEHALTVVVKADSVTTHTVTMTKDTARPYVQYTSPFETDRYAPPPESVSVNKSRVVLGGNFTDVTGVTNLRLTRTTTHEVGSATVTDTERSTASGFNGSFTHSIFLGVGENNVTVRYYDRVGNVRVHRFQLVLEDTAPPTLSNLSATRRSPDRVEIGGVASDNGQIRSVSVQAKDAATSGSGNRSANRYLVAPGTGRPNPERRRTRFDTTFELYPDATALEVEATDTAGNTVERTVSVRRTIEPDLRLHPTGTRYATEGTVAVQGRVTDGEIASASVETVDPDTGEVVDITTIHEGSVVTDLAFERSLGAPAGRNATIRLRVIDSAGTEHVQSVNRTLATDTPTPTSTPAPPTAAPTTTPAPPTSPTSDPPTATPAPEPTGLTIPVIGVTVPVPSVFGASVSIPVPVVGPFDVPVVPTVGLVVLGLGAVARLR